MNTSSIRLVIVSLTAVVATGTCRAEDDPVDVDFNAAVGMQYDSDVALVELDSSASQADKATVLEAGLRLEARLASNIDIELGYDYLGTDYRHVPDFDLDLHHGRASVTVRNESTDASLAVDRFEGILAGEDYLVLTQVSPSVSRLFGTRLFLRGAYVRAEKSYAALAARDASSDAVRGDAYLLFNGMDHYVALGIQATSEDAADAGYDYAGTMGMLTWGYRVDPAKFDVRLRAQLRYEQRDYDRVTLDSGETRADDRVRARLTAAIPLSKYLSLGGSIEHTDNDSTFEDAVLDRTVYGLKLGVKF